LGLFAFLNFPVNNIVYTFAKHSLTVTKPEAAFTVRKHQPISIFVGSNSDKLGGGWWWRDQRSNESTAIGCLFNLERGMTLN